MDEKRDVAPTVDWENGTEDVLSGAEIYKMIFESNKPWMLLPTEQYLQQNMKVLFRLKKTLVSRKKRTTGTT